MSTKGALIAAMAAGLFSAGAPVIAHAADTAKIKCEGGNSCKGKSACHGAKNACAGQNGCKGKGWVEMSAEDCKKAKEGNKEKAAK
jgi:hypothetical protein